MVSSSSPNTNVDVLTILLTLLPLIGAIWRVGQIKADLDSKADKLRHAIELLQVTSASFDDKLTLSINGTRELAEHLRTRTQNDTAKITSRLDQVESFLAKTTSFEPRH